MPEIKLPGLPAMVQAARRGVRALLENTDCTRIEEAELIVSELASNAVLHSKSRGADNSFRIVLQLKPGWMRLEVVDDGPITETAAVDEDEEEGALPERRRGLLIVDAIADQWGHCRLSETRALYWAELAWDLGGADA